MNSGSQGAGAIRCQLGVRTRVKACHSEAPASDVTVRSPRALGVRVSGRWATRRGVDELDLDDYHSFHATRADLLRRLGRNGEAAVAYERAAAMAPTAAERDFLALGGRASR